MAGKTARRSRGDGGLYQRADGMWVGTIELGWGADGKRKRKTVSSRDHATALRRLREVRASVDHGVIPSSITVGEWMARWLDSESVRRLRPRTIQGYRTYVTQWIVPVLGRKQLAHLTPTDVERLLRQMEDAGKAIGSRRQARAVLQSALKVAMREQLVPRNVAALAAPPSGHQAHHDHLTIDEARAVLRTLQEHAERGDWATTSRWLVALLAGLRQGEALGLTWAAVNETAAHPLVDVRQSVQRIPGQGLVVGELKSASSYRTVPLMAPAAAALAAWRADSGGHGFVWGGRTPTDPRRDWAAWKALLAEAGVRPVPVHGARSTCASILFDAGVPDLTVSRILGHSQVQITRDRYVRSTTSQYADALDAGLRHLMGAPTLGA